MNSEKGFTLIELLTVMMIISILAGLGLQSMRVYRARGANAVAIKTLSDARTDLESSFNVPDVTYPFVALVSQSNQGPVANASARTLLPHFVVPRNIKFQVYHDPACDNAACTLAYLQSNHCFGDSYTTYQVWGDGIEVRMDVAGKGCS